MITVEATRALSILGVLAFFAGCDSFWLDAYWRSERYILIAIDTRGQMSLTLDQGNGTGLGLVGPTIYSIGADDKYIVLKQHPSTDAFGAFDRSVTNYFVVQRTDKPSFDARKKGVRGPMTKEEFDFLTATLSLPTFTKTFADLQ